MLDSKTAQITIYTTSWCGPCKSAKRFLSDQGFDFTEIDIEKENINREEMESMKICLNTLNRIIRKL